MFSKGDYKSVFQPYLVFINKSKTTNQIFTYFGNKKYLELNLTNIIAISN